MKRSRLVVPFALAATLLAATPASAVDVGDLAVALPACQSAFGTKITEYHETHYMVGEAAVPGATEVRLTCGLVRWGETVATISDRTTGPVAVVAGSVTIMGALHDVCYVIEAWYPDGTYRIQDACP